MYSIHISDLLVRTAVEIEAISKHLYELNGGNMNPIDDHGNPRSLFFDSDCIQYLDLRWGMTKKVVNVVASNFYFEKKENRILRPLKGCNKQGQGRWKKAYQAVKHDRVKSLCSGNIGNLIRAMAALYLLNIYNSNDDKICDLETGTTEIDTRLGSDVFSVSLYEATMLNMAPHMDDSCIDNTLNDRNKVEFDSAVLIDRFTEESFMEMHKTYTEDMKITQINVDNSQEIKEFLSNHPEFIDKTLNEICIACGESLARKRLGIEKSDTEIPDEIREAIQKAGRDFFISIMSFSHTINSKPARRELILNKGKSIYPSV